MGRVDIGIESGRKRVYRRMPTPNERARIEAGNFVGGDLLLATIIDKFEPPTVSEEALMAAEHQYIFSDDGPKNLLVPAAAVAKTLRQMWSHQQPDSNQYLHAAAAFDGMQEVFVVPYITTERAA